MTDAGNQAAAGGLDVRYLTAKVSVDDRAINRHVRDELARLMPAGEPELLEVGAGLGTMVARLVDWGIARAGTYTLLDVDEHLLEESRRWLREWAARRGVPTESLPDGLRLGDLRVRTIHAELGSHLRGGHAGTYDVLVANAVLDLVDLATTLPGLLGLLRPGGLYWFTINYDGESIFLPEDPGDDAIVAAYHRDMDERVRYGGPAGESRTGRRLFEHLRAAGAPVLAAGSSDWVVHPAPGGGYRADEAYFVGCILRTIRDALTDRVGPAELASWVARRQQQLRAGELTYIAHQLDVLGARP